jgi:hypothetical protein
LDHEEDYFVLSQDYLKKKSGVLTKLINYWRTESFYNREKVFKLALVITQVSEQGNPSASMISQK